MTLEEYCKDTMNIQEDVLRLRIENERLQKENSELKKKLKEKLKTIADKDLSFVAKFDALEQENAELKETLAKSEEEFNILLYQTSDINQKAENKLAQAKEIIEDFMITETGGIGYSKLYDKAEQFLKDTEK